jgi:hypothetical protein
MAAHDGHGPFRGCMLLWCWLSLVRNYKQFHHVDPYHRLHGLHGQCQPQSGR